MAKAQVTELKADHDAGIPIEKAPEMSEEDQHNLRLKMAAMDSLLASQKMAKYKLELFFGKARSMHKPVPGALSFWESGTKLHGGGDVKVYFCPGRRLKMNNCETIIPFEFNSYGFLVCSNCKKVWKGDQVIGEVLGVHTMRQWSELLFMYFHKLGHNCDIYLKHSPDDIRSVARREQEKDKRGELLLKARTRALHVYPLKNIIIDTSNGADLLSRFYSFLTS